MGDVFMYIKMCKRGQLFSFYFNISKRRVKCKLLRRDGGVFPVSKSSSVYFVGLVETGWGMPSYIYLHTTHTSAIICREQMFSSSCLYLQEQLACNVTL